MMIELHYSDITNDPLIQIDNLIEKSIYWFLIGRGYDNDDIHILTEPPERYDQHPDKYFKVAFWIDNLDSDSDIKFETSFECDGKKLKSKVLEKEEYEYLINQFNKWFKKVCTDLLFYKQLI